MNILERIKQHKIQEVNRRKLLFKKKQLEQSEYFNRSCFSLKEAIENPSGSGIIAEFKRKSPSKGDINPNADVHEVTSGYAKAGAAALSVLTDAHFFGALSEDFFAARKSVQIPILRKDFMIDEYQIIESKAMGADVVLLIAKLLSYGQIKAFTELAHNLGMEVLTEFHNEKEIREKANSNIDLAGINNRNLNSFEVDTENSIRLGQALPDNVLKIAESGIESAQTIEIFIANGFSGFLIGEYFMRNPKPDKTCKAFINQLKQADRNFKSQL
jgi:indole-3-glycerol phosphate synthase